MSRLIGCASLLLFALVSNAQAPASAPPKPDAEPAQAATTESPPSPAQSPAASRTETRAAQTATDKGAGTKSEASGSDEESEKSRESDGSGQTSASGVVELIMRVIAILAGLGALGFFAWMLYRLLQAFLNSIEGEGIAVHSNWGGFGGGRGGWSLSRPFTLLLAVLLLASFTYGIANAVLRAVTPNGQATEQGDTEGTESTDSQSGDEESADEDAGGGGDGK